MLNLTLTVGRANASLWISVNTLVAFAQMPWEWGNIGTLLGPRLGLL